MRDLAQHGPSNDGPQSKKVAVTLLAGYMEEPIWYQFKRGDDMLHEVEEAAEQLGFTEQLARDLMAWDAEYQATLDHEYPPDSHFPTPEAEQAWVEKGKELAARIKQESPIVASVGYQADDRYDDGTCMF